MSNEELNLYLESYVISEQVFDAKVNASNVDTLTRYYSDSYNKASSLVIDGELVGITFDNLDIIKNLIKSKHSK